MTKWRWSIKFSKNKDNVLKYAVALIPIVITLKYIVFIWNYNNTEIMPPNRAFSTSMHFSAWILFTGGILLFALEQHPLESHLQLPLLVVEHCFFPKIATQGIQIDCFTKYIATKRFLIRAMVQARTSRDVTSRPVCILRWAGS